MDRIAAMTAFARVVEAGSFTRAAGSLDLPKASVTRLVQALETELGVRLLQRTTRALAVTVEGAALYERVVALLGELQDMDDAARGPTAAPGGRLRVSTPPLMCASVLVPALPRFHARYPEVELEFLISNRLVDLVADQIDCAIRVGPPGDRTLTYIPIGAYRFLTCASPDYLRRHPAPQSPQALAGGHATVGLVSGTGSALPFLFAREDDPAVLELQLDHVLLLNDSNAHLAAARCGIGIIQLPPYFARGAIARGELVTVLDEWAWMPPRTMHLVHAAGREPGAALRAFIDWTVQLFAEMPRAGRSLD